MPSIERTIAANAAPAGVWEYLSDFPGTNDPFGRLGDGAEKGLEDALARL